MATQPGTGLAIFDPKGAVPAHIANFMNSEATNIAPRTTVPSLSPEGKTWTISIDGQKSKMQRRNQDGDIEPLPIMKVVILDFAKQRGRAFYEGEYDPAKASAPICWSDDGVTPDSSLPGPFAAGTAIEPGTSRKISAACASCPNAVKGSKVTPQGKAVTACGQHLMVAILPDPLLGLPEPLRKPLRLKLAMTSVWDKQSPDEEAQGWLAFDNYVQHINARGIKHTASIVTKMKFDPNAAFPKIFFQAERFLDPAELAAITPLLHDEDVTKLLGGTWTPAGVDGIPKDQQPVAQPQPADEPGTADEPVLAAAAPPPAAAEPAPAATGGPAGYSMNPAETFTYEQYRAGGWTDEQLISNGKLIAAAPPAAQAEVVLTPVAPAAAPAVAPADAVIVGEPTPAAAAAAPTAVVAETSPPAAEVVVITDAQPASPGIEAPAAVVVQEPAQGTAPPPVAAAQPAEPPAAAAAAAGVTAEVSTDVPSDVEALMSEWG